MKKVSLFFLIHLGICSPIFSQISISYKDLGSFSMNFDLGALLVENGDLIFDVGAHMGNWTQTVIQKKEILKAYLFEPVPRIFGKLRSRFANHENIFCYQEALYSSVGEALFHVNVTPQGADSEGSSLYLTHGHLVDKPITVKTNTIDNFCDKNGIQKINFIKIDAEGADHYVIYGARNLIDTAKIDFIQFEYSTSAVQKAGTSFKEIYNFLTSRDYFIFLMEPGILKFQHSDQPLAHWGDYLAVHKNSMPRLALNDSGTAAVQAILS